MGKTNLDQFACGLVGTRTPYGIPGEMTQTAGSAYALADMRQLGSMQQAAHYLVKMRSIAVAQPQGVCVALSQHLAISLCGSQPMRLTTASPPAARPAARRWPWPRGCARLPWAPTRLGQVRSAWLTSSLRRSGTGIACSMHAGSAAVVRSLIKVLRRSLPTCAGRVPAGNNGIVGIKPSVGRFSTTGALQLSLSTQ